jgi:hypothetical protein
MAIFSPIARRRTLGRGAPVVGVRDRLAALLARSCRWAIRATGSGAGNTLPGRLAEWVAPGVLGRAAVGLRPIVLVSATNGKTTTTALISAALRAAGRRVVTNSSGSNLHRGLTAAVLSSPGVAGCAVLEVDEATLPGVVDELDPDMLVLLNLSRDQLDRFHEVHTVASRWRSAAGRLHRGARVVAVDHDPLVVLEVALVEGCRAAPVPPGVVQPQAVDRDHVGAAVTAGGDQPVAERLLQPLAHRRPVHGRGRRAIALRQVDRLGSRVHRHLLRVGVRGP